MPGMRHPEARSAQRLRVSIVIPAFNEEGAIGRCLTAALTQTVPAHEIIVVDNLSTDATVAVVREVMSAHRGSTIRLVSQCRVQGLIPTRNAGFAAATSDVFGRIDADTALEPTWVESVCAEMASTSTGAVTGPVSYYDLPLAQVGHTIGDLARRAFRGLGSAYPFLYGSNMAIRASAWKTIKHEACLDPEDLLHEDIDLAVHLYNAGILTTYNRSMRASVSARRMDTAPEAFRDYVRRFDRTYAHHQIDEWHLGIPSLALRSIYWPIHLSRSLMGQATP